MRTLVKIVKHPGKVFEAQYRHFSGYGSNIERALEALVERVIKGYEKLEAYNQAIENDELNNEHH